MSAIILTDPRKTKKLQTKSAGNSSRHFKKPEQSYTLPRNSFKQKAREKVRDILLFVFRF